MVMENIRKKSGYLQGDPTQNQQQINLYKVIPRLPLKSYCFTPWFGDSEPLAVLPQVRPDIDGWLPGPQQPLDCWEKWSLG